MTTVRVWRGGTIAHPDTCWLKSRGSSKRFTACDRRRCGRRFSATGPTNRSDDWGALTTCYSPLVRVSVLASLPDDAVRAIVEAARPRMVAARETIAHEGEPATFAGLVEAGHLKLTRVSPQGTEIIVRHIGPGDPFGAVALIPNAVYPVTATAVMPCRMLIWPKETLAELAARYPALTTNLMAAMSRHMTDSLGRIQDLTGERVPQRVAKTLAQLAETSGVRTEEGLRIAHPLTRQELADLTGTSLFTVSRLVAAWESHGLLRTGRGWVTVVDIPGLLDAAAATE